MHGDAHGVFHQRGFERVLGLLDEARHLETRQDDALGGELMQGLEVPADGNDCVQRLSAVNVNML